MPVKLLKKTGDLYYGFHQKIGQSLYIVHPAGVEEAPKGVMDIFIELTKEVDLSFLLPSEEHGDLPSEEQGDLEEESYMVGDEVFIMPTDDMPVGFGTIINGIIYTVSADSKRPAPQILVDAVNRHLEYARANSRQIQAQPINTGEGSYIREETVVTPTVPVDPNAPPPNWDQKPTINIPNLVGQASTDQGTDQPHGPLDPKIPTIAFGAGNGGALVADQPLPTERLDLADGEQIVTG